MKQPAAATSRDIKMLSVAIVILNAFLYVGGYFQPVMLLPAGVLTVVMLLCWYFWTPVAYEIAGGELVVYFRIGRQRYGPVVSCSTADIKRTATLRLFGNGGLFAGSGIFWNRPLGVFRAYVTTSKREHLVLVRTGKTKIVISPSDPSGFLVAPP